MGSGESPWEQIAEVTVTSQGCFMSFLCSLSKKSLVSCLLFAVVRPPDKKQSTVLFQRYDVALALELHLNVLRAIGNSRLGPRELLYEQINTLTFV